MNTELTSKLTNELLAHGATLVGVGSLKTLPAEARDDLPFGVSVAVKYPAEVIQGIANLPTQEYCDWYVKLNELLDSLVTRGATLLQESGYTAIAQTRERVGFGEDKDYTILPHKTVATRAGIGWIGKSALLVTAQYGSMIRLSSILTNAPLTVSWPINQSQCGSCMLCTNACPGGAIKGREWSAGIQRKELLDAALCRKTARKRAKLGFGGEHTICGKCIEVCPHTRAAIKRVQPR